MGRKFKVQTNRRGEYVQIGLPPGQYRISATKDNLSDSHEQRIGLDAAEVNLTLKAGGAAFRSAARQVDMNVGVTEVVPVGAQRGGGQEGRGKECCHPWGL